MESESTNPSLQPTETTIPPTTPLPIKGTSSAKSNKILVVFLAIFACILMSAVAVFAYKSLTSTKNTPNQPTPTPKQATATPTNAPPTDNPQSPESTLNGDTINSDINLQEINLILDSLPLLIKTAFLPDKFASSDPGDTVQVATSFSLSPFQEFSITTAKYGQSLPTENISNIEAGNAQTYRDYFANFRRDQGGDPQLAPAIQLFGKKVAGSYSIVTLDNAEQSNSNLIIEWITESEGRLWLVRTTHELKTNESPEDFLKLIESIEISTKSR